MSLNNKLMREFLKNGKETIFHAGNIVLSRFKENIQAKEKHPGVKSSVVTEVDKESNEFSVSELKKVYPDFGFLSEEGIRIPTKDRYLIQIDPLDGTGYYLRGSTEFAIAYSLVDCHTRQPIAGVIYRPLGINGWEIYTAMKGHGARLEKKHDGKRTRETLKVSKIFSLEKAKAVKSRYLDESLEGKLREAGLHSITEIGGAINKACMVVRGEAEIYIHHSNDPRYCVNEWDTSAGKIILMEAGGDATDIHGEDLEYNNKDPMHKDGIIMTNGILHTPFLKALYRKH